MYKFNLYNTIIASGVINGFIYSGVVLYDRKYNTRAHIFLVFLVLLISLSNLYYWFIDTGIYDSEVIIGLHLDLLILPFYYSFICFYLNIKPSFFKILFVPFLIRQFTELLIVVKKFFFADTSIYSDNLSSFLMTFDAIATVAFMLFMLYIIFKTIINYEKNSDLTHKKSTHWLRLVMYFGFALVIIFALSIIFRRVISEMLNVNQIYYLLWIGLSFLIYWLGYLGIHYLSVKDQRENIRKNLATSVKRKIENNNSASLKRFVEIDRYTKDNKLYLNPHITLTSLCKYFNISDGYLSQLINKNTDSNFSTYINNLRIEESKSLLTNLEYKEYTIVAIALESGFNSKSVFYNAFKKQTGMSPTQFKKAHLNIS